MKQTKAAKMKAVELWGRTFGVEDPNGKLVMTDLTSYAEAEAWIERHYHPIEHPRCAGCDCKWREWSGPMLVTALWAKVAPHGEKLLCVWCMRRRLGRPFRDDDLTQCPWNDEWNREFGAFRLHETQRASVGLAANQPRRR
jgi:hypothetical protein